jgi:hypothetical protein
VLNYEDALLYLSTSDASNDQEHGLHFIVIWESYKITKLPLVIGTLTKKSDVMTSLITNVSMLARQASFIFKHAIGI